MGAKTIKPTAWACNRCNLVTEQERHPGRCVKCGCPEHRMVPKPPPANLQDKAP